MEMLVKQESLVIMCGFTMIFIVASYCIYCLLLLWRRFFSFTASSELGSVIFWGAFFAAIPDVVEFLGRLLKSRLVISFFEYAHSSLEGPRWWYTQWVIGGVALVVLLTC